MKSESQLLLTAVVVPSCLVFAGVVENAGGQYAVGAELYRFTRDAVVVSLAPAATPIVGMCR
jgi:hypothetical protein